ncbi:MAG: sensor histidine kinase, partial [Pseudomonadota bacterium]
QQAAQTRSVRDWFSRQLIKTTDNERRTLARELHDGLGQGLLSVKNLLSQMPHNPSRLNAVEQVKVLITDTRNLARNMHPQQIENLGFTIALETMLNETIVPAGLYLNLNLDDVQGVLNKQAELHLFRIAQEAATNSVRHARANKVEVTLKVDNGEIQLMICDDGIGIDASNTTEGIGIFNMRERAAILGAKITIEQNESSGSCVQIITKSL